MKKSIYLFSVALLGLSLCPSSVFADESPEIVEPNVTAEFVESPANMTEPVETTESAEEKNSQAETQEITEGVQTVESDNEVAPESVTEVISEQSPEAQEKVETNSEPETSSSATQAVVQEFPSKTTESTVDVPIKTTKLAAPQAASQTLKEDHDGKIVDHGKATSDENAKISSEYNFMPNFENLEGIEVGGTKNYTENSGRFEFDLTSAAQNTITVTYKNVGTYNGKVIDMKVTVKDWTILASSPYSSALTLYKTNGIAMYGIKDVRLNYAFIDHLTGGAVSLSGFFNFTDIDLNQSIDLFDSNNVQNYYVTKDNVLYYKVHNGYIKIGEINGVGSNENNMDHWLTYTYKNISEFDVRYNQDHETGAVFKYTYQAPVLIEEKPSVEPEEPEKPLAPQDPQEPQEPQEPKANKEEPKKTAPVPVLSSVAIKEKTKLVYTTQQPILTSTAVSLQAKTTEVQQPTLPQTNEKKASIFTTLGGACLVLLSGLFIVKRKSNEE